VPLCRPPPLPPSSAHQPLLTLGLRSPFHSSKGVGHSHMPITPPVFPSTECARTIHTGLRTKTHFLSPFRSPTHLLAHTPACASGWASGTLFEYKTVSGNIYSLSLSLFLSLSLSLSLSLPWIACVAVFQKVCVRMCMVRTEEHNRCTVEVQISVRRF